jgi:hypothetical protein
VDPGITNPKLKNHSGIEQIKIGNFSFFKWLVLVKSSLHFIINVYIVYIVNVLLNILNSDQL